MNELCIQLAGGCSGSEQEVDVAIDIIPIYLGLTNQVFIPRSKQPVMENSPEMILFCMYA